MSKAAIFLLINSIVKRSAPKCYKHASFFHSHTFMFSSVTNAIESSSQNKYQLSTSNKNINLCENTKNTNYSLKLHKLKQQMVRSSCTKSSVSIDLFNLPPLLDASRQSTMQCEISNNFSYQMGKTHDSARSSIIGHSTD